MLKDHDKLFENKKTSQNATSPDWVETRQSIRQTQARLESAATATTDIAGLHVRLHL